MVDEGGVGGVHEELVGDAPGAAADGAAAAAPAGAAHAVAAAAAHHDVVGGAAAAAGGAAGGAGRGGAVGHAAAQLPVELRRQSEMGAASDEERGKVKASDAL